MKLKLSQSNAKATIGVDTHKETLACYCNDGRFKEFKTTLSGFKEALKWAPKDCNWVIEGAYCFGAAFSSFLTKQGCRVYEINPLLTKNWRNTLKVASSKNDYGDAKVISLFANTDNLEEVSFKTIRLKEKLTARKLLIKQKTQITNSVKMLFYTRGKELPFKSLDTKKAISYLIQQEDIILKNNGEILKAILNSIKSIEKELEKELREQIPTKIEKLIKLEGISIISAATIYTETKGRLRTKANFASFCGIAPIDCSSGKTTRKRNNKGGNRILNSIFLHYPYIKKDIMKKLKHTMKEKYQKVKHPDMQENALRDNYAILYLGY